MRLHSLAMFVLIGATLPHAVHATANFVYHEQSSNITGGTCGVFVDNLTPAASDPVNVKFRVEYQFFTDQVRLYYTTDGTQPAAATGTASGTTQVVSASWGCTYVYGSNTIDVVSATIPAQPAGTQVKYLVSAWHSGGGPEIFANSGTCDACTACSTSTCASMFSYQVASADAGTAVDAAPHVDANQPDSAPHSDARQPDTAAATDAAHGDNAIVHDAAIADARQPDTAATDRASVDHAVGSDTQPIADAGHADLRGSDLVAADAARTDSASGTCTPGCQDDNNRIVCNASGQPLVVPCTGGTTCRDGRCVSSTELPADDGTGCGCAGAAGAAPLALALLTLGLLRRRR